MTTLVACSDTHGKHDDVDVPDRGEIFVHAGDITGRGRIPEVEQFDNWMSLRRQPHRVVVAGNHDACFEQQPEHARHHLRHATYLQDAGTTIEGLEIWGSPWTPQFFDWSFMLPRGERLAAKWQMIPEETDILVTHGPPHGILDEAQGVTSAGCEALRERVFEVDPEVHVFGHIHEARGTVERRGITFVNASCYGGGDPFVLEI